MIHLIILNNNFLKRLKKLWKCMPTVDWANGLVKVVVVVPLVEVGIDTILRATRLVNVVMLPKEVVIVLVWEKSMLLDYVLRMVKRQLLTG